VRVLANPFVSSEGSVFREARHTREAGEAESGGAQTRGCDEGMNVMWGGGARRAETAGVADGRGEVHVVAPGRSAPFGDIRTRAPLC